MSDREAFVAAIAATPADDLPRLVFADWLEENGDPERAEFVRTQIRWRHATEAEEKRDLNRRAAELFRGHWRQWLKPFLTALDPHINPDHWYEFRDTGHAAMLAPLNVRAERIQHGLPAVTHLYLSSGFVSVLGVRVMAWSAESDVDAALRLEPVRVLQARVRATHRKWASFSQPTLRRIDGLLLTEHLPDDRPLVEAPTVFLDPHLAGVRDLSLGVERDAISENIPVHPATLSLLARSPLGYRLTGLELPCVDVPGLRSLFHPDRLQLERLTLGGPLTADAVGVLEDTRLLGTLKELDLASCRLEDGGVVALARGSWRSVTHLGLNQTGMTAGGLPALAAAAFTPQLKVLDLSDNRLFFDWNADLAGLKALAEVLDPDRLELLNLADTGLPSVPEFLADRFGDRVTI